MKTPPRFAKALLRRFCSIEFLEEIEGDLDEQFESRVSKKQVFIARLAYWRDVFHALVTTRNNRRESKRNSPIPAGDMMRHLFLVSIRHLQRRRSMTVINAAGLAVSLACFLLISLYLIDEKTYDMMHPNASRVYRISQSFRSFGDGAEMTDARAPGMWTRELKEALPEVLHYTRMSRFGYPGTVRNDQRDLRNIEQQFFWVDSTYTDIFTLPLVMGTEPAEVLKQPGQVIISQTTALKYFGSEDPMGKMLIYSRDGLDIPLVVAAVMKDYPSNVHFHPDFISSNLALSPLWNQTGEINSSYSDGNDRVNSWSDSFTYSYIELAPGTDIQKVDKTLRRILTTNLGEDAKYVWPTFVKLTDIHFRAGMIIELESAGDPVYVYIFGSIGILILLIACINYMNMSTARSMQRSREVGLRKALGVRRGSLVLQFLGESILLTIMAMILALGLVGFALPMFRSLTGCTTTLQELLSGKSFLMVTVLTFLVGVISGSYPAFFLSGFRPLDTLKGRLPAGGNGERFRKSLVVFQFAITLLLVVGTFVIHRQLSFVNETKLSNYQDQVLTIRLHGLAVPALVNGFSEKVRSLAAVERIATGSQFPKQDRFPTSSTKIKVNGASHKVEVLDADSHFPDLFELEFIAGRNFSALNLADTASVLINESMLKDLQMTASEAPGLILEMEFTGTKREVIGVVKDFNTASMRTRIQPMIITGYVHDPEVMYVKFAGSEFAGSVASIEKIWKEVFPSAPFSRWFLNEEFETLYHQERSTGTLSKYFAGLAIFVGCLGLFGLASFTVEQRTREIGIRKVLGATGNQIVGMIIYQFVRLILISLAIGLPISAWLMNVWLHRFAYRAEIGWYVFAASSLVIVIITFITVSMESVKAAFKNPVDAIRHE